MERTIAASLLKLIVIFNSLSPSHTCVLLEKEINLDLAEPMSPQVITFIPSKTSLTITCRGSTFANKTWDISAIFSNFSVRQHTESDLSLHIDCRSAFQPDCFNASLTCSGERKSTGDKLSIPVILQSSCPDKKSDEYISATNSNITTATAALIEDTTEKSHYSDMDYFGIIIGFSICLALGIVSALIVCMQKKCNFRKWSKLFGSNCVGYRSAALQETHDVQRTGKLTRAGPAIPMMGFGRVRQNNGQHFNKMNTHHEV